MPTPSPAAARRAAALLSCALATTLAGCGDDDPTPSADAGSDAAHSDTGDDVGTDTPDADAGSDAGADAAPDVPTGPAPVADIFAPRYAIVGETVSLDASRSENAVNYDWEFGDGRTLDTRTSSSVGIAWPEAGRYQVRVNVASEGGRTDSTYTLVTVVDPLTFEPKRSGSIVVSPENEIVAVVSPDAGEVSVFQIMPTGMLALSHRFDTCDTPRTITVWGDNLAVACPWSDSVRVHAIDGTPVREQVFAWGSRPFGVLEAPDGRLVVTLQGRGVLAAVEVAGEEWIVGSWIGVGPDPRGVALLPDGRLAVTRWRSPDDEGQITLVDLTDDSTTPLPLAFDDVGSSDTETGGVPTYLNTVAVSPNAPLAIVPSLQANISRGEYLDGDPLTHETTVRAAVSTLDLESATEAFERRKRFDDRGFASAAAFSPYGDYVYVTHRGSRIIERIDMFTGAQSGAQLNVGFALEDVAIHEDLVLVDAALSRELVVYDAATFGSAIDPIQRLSIVTEEPLSDELLLGAQLFNDSFDVRLTQDLYVACAHCHLDGESDRRTWDFTDRGEGMRNTISLLGREGTGHGPVHWSANFDEIHDFEHDIRGPFAGLGLMSDADFNSDTRNTPLGTPKAGVSADLDALAAFVTSLDRFPRSPARLDNGDLTEAAIRGQALFESDDLGCTSCHSGAAMTDSEIVDGVPRLHDVGTLTDASGQRLGGELPGLDTPTLRGVWNAPPFLHDGSAASLAAVIRANTDDAHGTTSTLSEQDILDLEEYLLSIE